MFPIHSPRGRSGDRFVRSLGLAVALAFAMGGFLPGAAQQPKPAGAGLAAAHTGPVAPPKTEAAKIASAMSAAPRAVSAQATIVDVTDQGDLRVLRQGTNGWTCIPDGPSPGVDPMCVDANGLEWVKAWIHHTPPPADLMGFGYMLAGGSDASNDDPFATAPPSGSKWVDTGPHVMVLNIGNRFAGYPASAANPRAPFIMFPGTPYQHLMLPVR